MVITLQPEAAAFDPETFPEWFWVSSLFGRVTHNLVLREELKEAYEIVERELKVVADIQRSLLPQVLPKIPTLRAGGILSHVAVGRRRLLRLFPVAGRAVGNLDRGCQRPWNARGRHDGDHAQPGPQPPGPADPPAALLGHVNRQLSHRYTASNEVFVTAFYGVYDPAQRTLTYSSAGHNPPRLKRCGDGSVNSLEEVGGPPLGLFDELEYEQTTLALKPGDILAFYTDGITEAMDAKNVQFGVTAAR